MVKARLNQPVRNLIPFSLYRRCLKYRRLPGQLLMLSVLKLDGSSFSIRVARNATVGKVKSAIEEEFRHSTKEGEGHLWSVVWRHFSLCYKGRKLLDEKGRIRKYGINDGDQLHFVQHLRVELGPHQSNDDVAEIYERTFL